LSDDFPGSLAIAQPLRQRLSLWYSSLPDCLRMRDRSNPSRDMGPDSNASLNLAYLTLEALLYRALLRPLGRSKASLNSRDPPTSRGLSDFVSANQNSQGPPGGHNIQGSNFMSVFDDSQAATEATISAAEHCAVLATEFTSELSSRDFSGFWYSWSRIGFAVISNFVILLLVQAPTEEHVKTSKAIADNWRQTLRFQSRSSDLVNLGMLRLDAIYLSGMDKLFICEPHVHKVL